MSSNVESPFPEENTPWYKEIVSIDHFLSFVHYLTDVNNKSLTFNNVDSKIYYKLRHNMLKTYVLAGLGLDNVHERPFSYYEDLQLQSSRTPDFLLKVGDEYLLIEFTVSNKYDTILKTKENFQKYANEINSSAVLIRPYYIFMSVDADIEDTMAVVYEISSRYGFKLSTTLKEELEDVHTTI